MQIVARTFEKMEVDSIRLLLESNGIPVYIGNENSNNISLALHSREYIVWVVLDEQLEDATALLKDDRHEVKNPIDVEQYYKELESNQSYNSEKLFNMIMVVVLCLAFGIFILFKVYN